MENLGFLFAIIPIAGVAILAMFIIGLVIEGRQAPRGRGVLHAFYYSVSLSMLALVVGSAIFLINLLLRVVLPNAEYNYRGAPPGFSLEGKAGRTTAVAPTCISGCELTESDRSRLATWRTQYQDWQQRNSNSARHQRDAVNGFSFFIVALPLYLVFFRFLQREARLGGTPTAMRSLYFYGFALIGLLMTIVSGALLVNVGLKTLFPQAAQANFERRPVVDLASFPPDRAGVQAIINCGSACNLAAADVRLARQWLKDAQGTGVSRTISQRQRDFAANLPVLLTGLPLFLYHFLLIRRESRQSQPPSAAPPPA